MNILPVKKSYKWIKIVAPILTLLTAGGIVTGYFASNEGQSIIRPHSVSANLHNESDSDQQNSSENYDNQKNSSYLKIFNQPNFEKNHRNVVMTENMENENGDLEIEKTISFSEEQKNNYVLFQRVIKLTEKEFLDKIVKQNKEINLGFVFGLELSHMNQILREHEKLDISNQITGFNLEEMAFSGPKKRTVKAFRLPLEQIAANLSGNLLGDFTIEISKQRNVTIQFQIKTEQIQKIDVMQKNQEDENLNIQLSLAPLKIMVFHDGQSSSENPERFFWQNPDGPEVSKKLRNLLPRKSVQNLSNDSFQLQDMLNSSNSNFDSNTKKVTIDYQKIENDESISNNKNYDLFKVVLTRNQWEKALYQTSFPEGEPTRPGLQIAFNLLLDLFDNDMLNVQKYNAFLYGFISTSDLRIGAQFKQEITNYNLAQERNKNQGVLKINMLANLRLNSDLEIQFTANISNLLVKKENWVANDSDLEKAQKLVFNYQNVQINSYYDTLNPAIASNSIQPILVYNFDQQEQYKYNSQITNMNIFNDWKNTSRGKYDDKRAIRESWYSIRYSGFYYNYKNVDSSQGTIDISDKIEKNSDYAKNSFLTFNFAGHPNASNLLAIDSSARNSAFQTITYHNNLDHATKGNNNSQTNYPVTAISRTNKYDNSSLNQTQNDNIFQVKIGALNTNETTYLWKNMVVYSNSGNDEANKAVATASYAWNKSKPTYKNSLLTAKFEILLWRSSDYQKVYYKLRSLGSSYLWDWNKNHGPQAGNIGYFLKSTKLDIRTS